MRKIFLLIVSVGDTLAELNCGNHFTIYINQTMLYILNLNSDVCHLFINKTWGKTKYNTSISKKKKS